MSGVDLLFWGETVSYDWSVLVAIDAVSCQIFRGKKKGMNISVWQYEMSACV
jgi:hypothetical protein